MAIAVDAISNSGVVDGASGATWSHTVGSGANRILIIASGSRDFPANDNVISTVTYGGVGTGWSQAVARVRDVAGADFLTGEIWDKVAPASGTANIIVTYTGTVAGLGVGAISLTGVNQSTPRNGSATDIDDNPGGNMVTNPVTTMAGCMAVDTCGNSDAPAGVTMDSAQTEICKLGIRAGSDIAASSYKSIPTATTASMTWVTTTGLGYFGAACQTYAPSGSAVIKDIIGGGIIPFRR